MTIDPRNDFYPERHSCFLSFWTDMSTSRHNQSKHMVKTHFWIDGYIFVLFCNPSEQSWNSAGALIKISLSNQQNTHTRTKTHFQIRGHFKRDSWIQMSMLVKRNTHIYARTHTICNLNDAFFPPEYHVIVPFIGYICSLHPPCYVCTRVCSSCLIACKRRWVLFCVFRKK